MTTPTLGNFWADLAAKEARMADLALAQRDTDSVIQWRAKQHDMNYLYSQYLVQLSKAVVAARTFSPDEGAEEVEVQLDAGFQAEQWQALAVYGYPALEYPALSDQTLMEMQRPPWYPQSLWRWATGFKWPQSSPREDCCRGITSLELLLNYIVCTRCLPPRRTFKSDPHGYQDLCSKVGLTVPFCVRDVLLTFVGGIRALIKLTGINLFLSSAHRHIKTLQMYESMQSRKGLLDRPELQEVPATLSLLQAYLTSKESGCLRDYVLRNAPSIVMDQGLFARWAAGSASRTRQAKAKGI